MSEQARMQANEYLEICKEVLEKNSDARVVAISISYEDGARVTFEIDEGLRERMESENELTLAIQSEN